MARKLAWSVHLSEVLESTELTSFVSPYFQAGRDPAIAYALAIGIGWNREQGIVTLFDG